MLTVINQESGVCEGLKFDMHKLHSLDVIRQNRYQIKFILIITT